ncbi:FMN-binding protein [Enterococcus sp. AZ196]|uniref:FMN-binding protein n=1 Tax=Enterococcus sp. AZ196 TaxID=2774659 RepID=UPI003D26788C
MKKKGRTLLIIGLIALVLAGGYGIYYYNRFTNYKKAVQEIQINEPDLSTIKDGKYIGQHNVDFIFAKVEVEIKDHQFRSIKMLAHTNDRGENADDIPAQILEEQKIGVDAVSGATNSSKVIQKAVEKALQAD